jgi:hypothetical protein
MLSNSRCWLHALIMALALVACSSADPDDTEAPADASARRGPPPHRDAQMPSHDANAPDAYTRDAAVAIDGHGETSGDAPGGGGVVSCYSPFDPTATCALPTHCCFTNYSAERVGNCDTAACTWGTIDCDGPEDCANGQRCCAHVIMDPDNGITGYKLACQTDACGAAPANVELCHGGSTAAGTCDDGRACVSAASYYYDLPGTLSICQ